MTLPTAQQINFISIIFIPSTLVLILREGRKTWNKKDSSVGIMNSKLSSKSCEFFLLVSHHILYAHYSNVPWNPNSCSDSRCRWCSGRHRWGCLHAEHNLFHFLGSKPPLPMEKSQESWLTKLRWSSHTGEQLSNTESFSTMRHL